MEQLESKYKSYSDDQITELLSSFLISSWSYSKVSQFARNEKAFEMSYIYGQHGKSSATTVAGQAYHFALDRYFKAMQQKEELDLAFLEKIAYEYIEDFAVQLWKLQTTTPTVQDCKIKATKTVTKLLNNFFAELSIYLEEVEEVLDVEVYFDEWLNINGVDIPLPAHGIADLRGLPMAKLY
jgi:S-DNA-T family DNA segregation ATPase FtsK/SpoIIIE